MSATSFRTCGAKTTVRFVDPPSGTLCGLAIIFSITSPSGAGWASGFGLAAGLATPAPEPGGAGWAWGFGLAAGLATPASDFAFSGAGAWVGCDAGVGSAGTICFFGLNSEGNGKTGGLGGSVIRISFSMNFCKSTSGWPGLFLPYRCSGFQNNKYFSGCPCGVLKPKRGPFFQPECRHFPARR